MLFRNASEGVPVADLGGRGWSEPPYSEIYFHIILIYGHFDKSQKSTRPPPSEQNFVTPPPPPSTKS